MKNVCQLLSTRNKTFFSSIIQILLFTGLFIVLGSALFYGVDALSMLRFSYTLLFWVWGPGLLLSWFSGMRPKNDGFWVLGFAFGVILFSSMFAVSLYFSFTLAKTFLGPLSTVFFLLLFFKKHHLKDIRRTLRSTSFFWFCGILLVFVIWCIFFLRYPSPAVVNGATSYDGDFLWSVSNIEALQRSFPPLDARIQGKAFYYHYFSMLYRAALCAIGSVDSFNISTFFYPMSNIFFLIFTLRFLYISFARKKRYLGSCLFIFVTLFTSCGSSWYNLKAPFGFFYNVFYHHILMPTHGFELSISFFALALGVLSNIPLWYGKWKNLLFLILFFLTFAATASKGPAGLLITMSAGAPLLIFIFLKDFHMKTTMYLQALIFSFLAALSGFVIAYSAFLLPSGGTVGLSLSPGWLAWRTFGLGHNYSNLYLFLIPFHIIGFLPFGAIGSAMSVLNNGKNIFKPANIVIFTSALFGILGAYFLKHVGMSNLYFMMFAAPCLNLLATEWAFTEWPSMKRFYRVVTISLVILAFTSFCFCAFYYGKAGFSISKCVFRDVPFIQTVSPFVLSEEEYAALNWIAKHTPRYSVLGSEKFWTSEYQGNEISSACFFYYSAFSKRQLYLEGWAYSSWAYPDRPNALQERNELLRRLNLLTDIFSNGEKAEQIMRQERIDYILVDRKERPDFASSSLKLVFENKLTSVYSLP